MKGGQLKYLSKGMFMYELAKIYVSANMKNNQIKCKIARKKYVHMSFHFMCGPTFAPFYIFKDVLGYLTKRQDLTLLQSLLLPLQKIARHNAGVYGSNLENIVLDLPLVA